MSNNRPWNPKGPRCTVRTKSSRKLSLTYQEELLFSKKKKEDKKRNKSKLKSKLTDEDIPDLADMLGEKLVKVVLVLFKVIFGLIPLDQAATLLEQTRLVFFFFTKLSWQNSLVLSGGKCLFLLATIAAVTYTTNQQFFFFSFFPVCFSSGGRSNEAHTVWSSAF